MARSTEANAVAVREWTWPGVVISLYVARRGFFAEVNPLLQGERSK
jgi:hypothetical protein